MGSKDLVCFVEHMVCAALEKLVGPTFQMDVRIHLEGNITMHAGYQVIILIDFTGLQWNYFSFFIIFMFCQIVFLEFHRWLRDWMFWCWTRTARSSKIGTDCEMLQGRDANLEARVGWLEHRCKMMESCSKHSKLLTLKSRKKFIFHN